MTTYIIIYLLIGFAILGFDYMMCKKNSIRISWPIAILIDVVVWPISLIALIAVLITRRVRAGRAGAHV